MAVASAVRGSFGAIVGSSCITQSHNSVSEVRLAMGRTFISRISSTSLPLSMGVDQLLGGLPPARTMFLRSVAIGIIVSERVRPERQQLRVRVGDSKVA